MESFAQSPMPDAAAQQPDAAADRGLPTASRERGRGFLRLGMASAEPIEQAHDAAVQGSFAEALKPREIVKCAEWMTRHEEPVSWNLWEGTYQIAMHGRSQRTRLIATRMLVDRIDPIPREIPVERGPVTFNVAIVNADASTNHTQHQIAPDGGTVRAINRERDGA